jgi:hypothetical protein
MATSSSIARPVAQLQFDWLLPADKPMLRVADIVAATGMKTTFVEEWFVTSGKCHRYEKQDAKRPPMRIPRAFAVELLISSAKYTADDKREAVASLAREFSAEDCEWIAARFREQATKTRK